MILEPGPAIDRPSETEMLGLTFLASGPDFKTLTVHALVPGSPAEQAGLRVGDRIVSVDGVPIADISLEQLWQLRTAAGRTVKVGVERDRVPLVVTIRIRRQI